MLPYLQHLCYMLQVAEDATRLQRRVDFGIERPLAFMCAMMDRKAGHNHIKRVQVLASSPLDR
jgi:hypothetical protein